MNTKTALIALAVVAVIAIGGWFALAAMPAAAPTVSDTMMTNPDGTTGTGTNMPAGATPAAPAGEKATVIVSYSDSGFYPKSVTIRAGDTVRFVNQSTHGMWVGGDEHPTHTEYDGTSTKDHCANGAATNGTFDQCSAAANGGTFEYTFTKAGTHGYHNHVQSADKGDVIVQS
ncbi:MAG: hypothetical protein AB199_01090 [Parcubacteria bacterium C7867-004]|nr:MAG: hypothetical protein AB199_01090 [Parcubacteria bacterium C7867-004]